MDIFVVHNRSYFHFVTESLVGLLSVMEKHNDYDPVLWYRSNEFLSTLQFFSSKPINIRKPLPKGCISAPTMFIGTPREMQVLHKLKTFIEARIPIAKEPEQVVIVKRLRFRTLGNFDELVDAVTKVSKLPVRVAVFEKMSFVQQVQLMQNTKLLIGAHGAGLTNLMFMPPKSGVVEIMPLGFYLTFFECMCETMGHTHYQIESEQIGNVIEKYKHLLIPYPCPRSAHYERFFGDLRVWDGVRDQMNFIAPIDRIVEHVKQFFK